MSITLAKDSSASPYGGHNSRTSYTKNLNGTVPEYALSERRYFNGGARVSAEWSYYLRDNDPMELWAFFGESRNR